MDTNTIMYKEILDAFLDRSFLAAEGLRRDDIRDRATATDTGAMVRELSAAADDRGRVTSQQIVETGQKYLREMRDVPPEGWLEHCYGYILNALFPHIAGPDDTQRFAKGRATALQLLRGVFEYERKTLPFDPTMQMCLLSDAEIAEGGFTREYLTMRRFMKSRYIYEFMRIGSDIRPFNTLGHVSGVHYVATYMADQLYRAGVPVDLGLISGAAATHDIGKYGCRKNEEKRVPYLHYYYTDYCLNRFDMPTIAHIAANHSTWDLELENLSVESLLLIYADFRVKSSRGADGHEIIHFYSLAEAFDVILGKLDNVDEAKKHRYQKVYNKLRDFEGYMTEHGAVTELPVPSIPLREDDPVPVRRETVLLHGRCVTDQVKFRAVDHNIRLMSRFNSSSSFAGLIESARSENQWKNIRTYISILGEYSTYMTEEQKSMTLRFLHEMLSHRESDIRDQAAEIMGCIVANYRESYKKELPVDIPAPDSTSTNLYTFEKYLDMILFPDHKYTEQHKKWITTSATIFVRTVIQKCRVSCRDHYLEIFSKYLDPSRCDDELTVVLAKTVLNLDPAILSRDFLDALRDFTNAGYGKYDRSVDIILLRIRSGLLHDINTGEAMTARRSLMGIDPGAGVDETLSTMFLDDLKTNTPWPVKTANISYMLEVAHADGDKSRLLHIATHLANLIKVSEMVTVRRHAGSALLDLIVLLPSDQRNELTIELFNGLEIGDYQFSKFIPDYLGIVILYLPPNELDETLDEFRKLLNAGNEKSASAALNTLAVTLENYGIYNSIFEEAPEISDRRRRRILGMIIKGFAYYDDVISQEAFRTLGEHVFNSSILSLEDKRYICAHCLKKLLSILPAGREGNELSFYNDAAVLNHIYRFLSEYQSEVGDMNIGDAGRVAFFPGTFDPFSLGHKAIATTIRDMGFEVYLALDEFSWSKKTQPRMLRRNILSMSTADEEDIYIFPDDISVNIANTRDLAHLKEIFDGYDLYMAVGSDVVTNASSYRARPSANSIHSFNHIVFARESRSRDGDADSSVYPITGDVIELTLRKYYEDISSTRIRENIDLGRDISNLLDPIVQNYIYSKNLYSREPAYKHVLEAKELNISALSHDSAEAVRPLLPELQRRKHNTGSIIEYLSRADVRTLYIENGTRRRRVSAFAAAHRLETHDLLKEFNDPRTAARIRKTAAGSIAVIGAFYAGDNRGIRNLSQILLTEILTELLAKDFAYAVYNPVDPAGMNSSTIEAFKRQGFVNISNDRIRPVYAVDMKSPVTVFRDVETVVKAPLNKDPKVLKALEEAHYRLLKTFTEIYPGQLILSFNTSAVYSKIVERVAADNEVSTTPDPKRRRGPYISVPFGKALSDVIVPNTVTKALRTEKYFRNDLIGFDIRESRGYATLDDQIRTIESFGRPVILIDDLLHKGQRIDKIDPLLRDHGVDVRKIVVGVLTGNARDNMAMRCRAVEEAYFIPTIKLWINERDCYPFIGGDSVDSPDGLTAASINMIMPYTSFSFVDDNDPESVFKYSMTCLENAMNILRVLEEQYQSTFEKKLTLKRLGAVITYPRRPDLGVGLEYDENLAPSEYVENDIRKLKRLHMVKVRKI